MYPFYVFELEPDATDAEVEARYYHLLAQHPPDRAPERFRILRAAYEAIRTRTLRTQARLFHWDSGGRALADELPIWLNGLPVRRLSEAELAGLLRGPIDE